MSTAHPLPTESEEIPLTDRRWRERWASELTRANQLEIALRKAEEAAADWQRIALQNGEDRAKAEVDAARERARAEEWKAASLATSQACDEWIRKWDAARARADKLAVYIGHDIEFHGESVADEHVRDLILEAGVECPSCEGSGSDGDEEFIGDPSCKYGYRTRNITVECEHCHGLGMVLR